METMTKAPQTATRGSLHAHTLALPDGTELALSEYAGQVVLLVNTASKCGFTPQLKELQQLQEQYQDQPFTVLAVPSPDFMNQEFSNSEETVCFYQDNYNARFPITESVHVRGKQQHPLFAFLSDKKRNGVHGLSPVWNFTKYLIDQQGQLKKVFAPTTKPTTGKVIREIEALL